jgi:UDP-glucose 4-epimerase
MGTALKILVTGGAGYIGSHMVKHLIEGGHQPIIVDDLSHGHPSLLRGRAFFKGNIADASLLDALFKKYPIDAVMHFASFIEVGKRSARH